MQKYSVCGLSDAAVEEQRKKGLVNETAQGAGKSVKEIIISNTFTYFNFIFVVIAVLLCIVGSFRNLTFLPIVVGNTLVGIFQELRAKRVLDKMSLLNAPHATVIRNGRAYRVKSEELVLGDTVVFSAGDQICADARVVEGFAAVNEALLTGEEDEIFKRPGDSLLSGSFVVSGECCAVLECVGGDAYISRLTSEAKKVSDGEQSEMIRSINKIVKWMGIALIPIGAVLFYQGRFVNHASFGDSVVSTVAAVIGMIPEGLYLLTTAAMTLGTVRLAKRKVLLNDMKSIEALARVDVLCVDKTGTITEPKMKLYKLEAAENGETDFEEALCEYVKHATDNNATMQALREYFKVKKPKTDAFFGSIKKAIPFSSALKYGAEEFEEGTLVLGAPDIILESNEASELSRKMQRFTKKGYRVILLAWQGEKLDEEKKVSTNIKPLGFAVLSNSIRRNAPRTFSYFKEQGVKIKVISGDNPETVSEIARLAGIDGAESCVDATLLNTDAELFSAAEKYTVFGRVTPKQKQKLVLALQHAGHTVAMTGDGVNDILALKSADCGIAMASGSEAVTQAAELVLMDSDFAHMPSVVNEGRRVVNNIQRSASLFLVKNIFSLLLSLMASVFMFTYPLEPTHISLISMFTIGVPGFLLALESNKNRIEGNFLRTVLENALPAGVTDAVVVGSLTVFGSVFGMSRESIATAATLVLAVVGFMILRHISLPFNKYRRIVFLFNIVGFILVFAFMPNLFSITHLPAAVTIMTVMFGFSAESLFRILTRLTGFVEKKIRLATKGRKPSKSKRI